MIDTFEDGAKTLDEELRLNDAPYCRLRTLDMLQELKRHSHDEDYRKHCELHHIGWLSLWLSATRGKYDPE